MAKVTLDNINKIRPGPRRTDSRPDALPYSLPAREIPCDASYDVIVIGGGPSGCTAAAAAAREGAKTLLIEATGALGGMGTGALGPAWCPVSDKEQIIYRSLALEVFKASKASSPHVPDDQVDWVPINPEALKRIYDDLVTGHGADVLFHTMLAMVDRDGGGRVNTIVTNSKAGLTAFSARVFVDCTGDADLAAWAGATFHKGNGKGGKLMPATHCFILSNVDDSAYRLGPQLHGNNSRSPMYAVVQSGKYPLIPDTHCCQNSIGPGTVGFNAGHLWDVDNTDPRSVSQALMKGRKMAAQYRDALAEFQPAAFGNAFLAATGALMGIRETRRIAGTYELTIDDYMARRSFPDEICRNSYFLDVHWAKEEAGADPEKVKKWEAGAAYYGKGESHGIPYRCLTPLGLSNVLVAGRSISCSQIVQGSIRTMPTCLAMGEAAGLAAALALPGADVHAVDVAELRARLKAYGAFLPDPA